MSIYYNGNIIASNQSSIIAVTKAQYDALSEADKQKNILYNVTDLNVPGSQLHYYFTEEKVVGRWVDGSLVYEKTVIVESIAIGETRTVIPFDGDDEIDIFIYSEASGQVKGQRTQLVDELFVALNNLNKLTVWKAGGTHTLSPLRLTARYTKMTGEASS